jgi:hypothetical protein
MPSASVERERHRFGRGAGKRDRRGLGGSGLLGGVGAGIVAG